MKCYVFCVHTGDQALRELASPGKSGSVFFVSHDDKYMIKTMRKVGRPSLLQCTVLMALENFLGKNYNKCQISIYVMTNMQCLHRVR